ncbi:DUF5694 domain-containing protein [Winogradskyella luteola]|uniref:Uncharacterized protein n=1 Tax=Winogradskyella luteola TaxID=2828330 RepID=A0A9X1F6C2_9FLAO|nr:DUF5694 domain-containing protein [Winogradskyella luteola]MBV7268064.1 hypothetical protein [Winogradskyella luteola]
MFKPISFLGHTMAALLILTSCNQNKTDTEVSQEIANDSVPDFLRKKQKKPQILLMGMFHFRDAGRDGYKPKFHLDVMSDSRQKEIEEITNALKEFNPTKIVIEVKANKHRRIDSLYNLYLQDKFELRTNEIFQLGFRLGKILKHEKLIAGDAESMGVDGLKDREDIANEENLSHLLSSDYGKLFKKKYEYIDSLKTTIPLKDFLIYINEDDHQIENHGHYILSPIGINNSEDYPKADALAAGWYSRNLRIFSNIRKTIENKNDRVLVIFGNGHMPIIKHAVKASPEMRLINLKDVL